MKKNIFPILLMLVGLNSALAVEPFKAIGVQRTDSRQAFKQMGDLESVLSQNEKEKMVSQTLETKPNLKDLEKKIKPDFKFDRTEKSVFKEGPGVGGGGGFAYYYTAIPNLVNLSLFIEDRIKSFSPEDLNYVLRTHVNWLEFLKGFEKVSVDIATEGFNEKLKYYQANGDFFLTAYFLEQINVTDPQISSIYFVTQVLLQILNESGNFGLSQDNLDKLTTILLSKYKTCGSSGSLVDRLNSCYNSDHASEVFTISRDFTLDSKSNPIPNFEVSYTQKSQKLWLKGAGLFRSGDSSEVNRYCEKATLFKHLGVKWRIPTQDEALALFQQNQLTRLFSAFPVNDPFFVDQMGHFMTEKGEITSLNGDKALVTFMTIGTLFINPVVGLLQLAYTQHKIGMYDAFTNRLIAPVCISEGKFDLTQINENAVENKPLTVTTYPQDLVIPNIEVPMTLDFSDTLIQESLHRATNRLKSLLGYILLDERDGHAYNDMRSRFPGLTPLNLAQFLKYFDSVHIVPEKLVLPNYRQNPDGKMEPLAFDYVLPEQLPIAERSKNPLGVAFPIRGFLLKYNQIQAQESDTNEMEILGQVVHEVSHLMGIGRKDDRDSFVFEKWVKESVIKVWNECPLDRSLTLEQQLDKCSYVRMPKGWKLRDREILQRDGVRKGFVWKGEDVYNETRKQIWRVLTIDKGEDNIYRARNQCQDYDMRLPYSSEIDLLYQNGLKPQDVFALKTKDGSFANCFYTYEGTLKCEDFERSAQFLVSVVANLVMKDRDITTLCVSDN
jgi:hypothetical protein